MPSKETLNEIKELQIRIQSLNFFKQYIQSIVETGCCTIKIDVSVVNFKVGQPLNEYGLHAAQDLAKCDFDKISEFIDKLVAELEQKLETL